MYNKTLTIFSVFHKEYPVPPCDFIKPIQVGKALTTVDLGFIKDDAGDNISSRNPNYCELTALYWIWKNLDKIDSKFIGLAHYRRYFTLPEAREKRGIFGSKTVEDTRDSYTTLLSNEGLQKACTPQLRDAITAELEAGKLVVPTKAKLYIGESTANTRDFYIYYHIREDWMFVEKIIAERYPEYLPALQAFCTGKDMHCYNMFIGSKAFVNEYCTWLFAVMQDLEQEIKVLDYPYQKRVFGFLGERLLNLFITKNRLETAAFPVVFFEG